MLLLINIKKIAHIVNFLQSTELICQVNRTLAEPEMKYIPL